MKKGLRVCLTLGFILTGGLMRVCQGAAGDPLKFNPTITIHVYNYAEVSSEIVKKAERVAAGVFRKAGVEIRWCDRHLNSGNNKEDSAQPEPLHASDIFLKIL